MRLKRDSWKIIEMIIMRYPDNKKEYEEYISDVIGSTGSGEGYHGSSEDYMKPQSSTEAKALRLTNAYVNKLEREINAVEFVYNGLSDEEKKVMRIRYWSERYKKIPYLKMSQCSYSERQMKRIVLKIITQVGRYLGEIN